MGLTQLFASSTLEADIASWSIRAVGISALVIILLIVLSTQVKDRFPKFKAPLFGLIVAVVSSTTVFLLGSTIYLNVISESNGPVHWHADIEYWVCDTEVELRDPYRFLSNKIGSSTLHEHNDKRIHLEGVVIKKAEDATLGNFMRIIDGELSRSTMTIPIHQERVEEDDNDGDPINYEHLAYLESIVRGEGDNRYLDLRSGETCGDGPDADAAEVQVFVYSFDRDNDTYTQTKLEDPAAYVYAPFSNIPPGDCVIFEFSEPKDFTDRLCNQYGLKDSERCVEFGVEEFDPGFCDITDVTDYSVSSLRGDTQINQTNTEEAR